MDVLFFFIFSACTLKSPTVVRATGALHQPGCCAALFSLSEVNRNTVWPIRFPQNNNNNRIAKGHDQPHMLRYFRSDMM